MKHEIRWNRGAMLLIGAIALFFAGILYGWSILKAPLQTEFGWSASALALNFTLTMCTFCLGGMLSGLLQHRVSLRTLLLCAAILSGLGFVLAAGSSANGILRLYISYGLMAGLGIGIAYNAVISVINAWFPDKKGTSSGVLMMSFGASALILGNTANVLMSGSFGWRGTYRILGILSGCSILCAAFCLRHPEQDGSRAGSETSEDRSRAVYDKDNVNACTYEDDCSGDHTGMDDRTVCKEYQPLEMIRRSSFWRLFAFLILASAVGNSTISMARDVALDVGASASLATLMAGLLSLCNGGGRLLAGAVFDRFGQRTTMNIDGMITMIAPVVMLLALWQRSVPLCLIGLCITGFSYAFQPPVTTSVVSAFYGQKHFPANYSIANLMLIPTSFAATIGGTLYGITGTYMAPFLMLLICSIISFLLNQSIREA